MQTRRTLLTSIAAVGAMAATGAHADDSHWPDHPVRIIVPYPAGGSTDVLTRILAERLKDMFGQSFVVENRGRRRRQYRHRGSDRQSSRTATRSVWQRSAISRSINFSTTRCPTMPNAT